MLVWFFRCQFTNIWQSLEKNILLTMYMPYKTFPFFRHFELWACQNVWKVTKWALYCENYLSGDLHSECTWRIPNGIKFKEINQLASLDKCCIIADFIFVEILNLLPCLKWYLDYFDWYVYLPAKEQWMNSNFECLHCSSCLKMPC